MVLITPSMSSRMYSTDVPARSSRRRGRTCSSKKAGLKLLNAMAACRFRQKGGTWTTIVCESLVFM